MGGQCYAMPTDAEKIKGRRAKRILYALMVVFVALPIVLFAIFR